MRKRKEIKPILEIGGVRLFVDLTQYTVKVDESRLTHYHANLELALEDMIDLMERKHLSRTAWCSPRHLLKGVEEVHKRFWDEVEKAKLPRKKRMGVRT